MGNLQSSSRSGERPQNRLSKPPTNLPPLITDSFKLDDATFSLQGPWLDSAIESPTLKTSHVCEDEPPEPVSAGGLGEMDFDLKTPSTLSVRMGHLKRRFSVPPKPKKVNRHSIDAKLEEVKPVPVMDRRVTVLDPLNANPSRGVTFADDTHFENQGTKRHSAFRRLSLRAPGIATRVSEKLAPPKRSVTNPLQDDEFHMYTNDQFTPEELLSLDDDTRPSSAPRPSLCRASTPTDLEYSYLGGLKLGSLRVVNGCASPAPSIVRPRSFSESTILSPSRDDLRGASRYGSSPDTNLEVSRVSSRHRLAQTTVVEEKVEVAEDEIEPSQDEFNTGRPCDASEAPSGFALDGDIFHDAHESAPPVVEDELFDEAVDTSTPRDDVFPDKPTDTSNNHPQAKRKVTTPGLSKSDSGYSSASSKYAYSIRRRRTAFYGSSGGTYCTAERPPPMPEITISPPQTPNHTERFPEMSPYTPPDLTLTFPKGKYFLPHLDTEIPSCNDFLESVFPETKALKEHRSWPLSALDVTHTMPAVESQNTPDPITGVPPTSNPQPDSPKAAKLTKPPRTQLTRHESASKYLARMKSLVNLRKQYCRRHTVHIPSKGKEKDEDSAANEGEAVSESNTDKKERVPNKLRRQSMKYDDIAAQVQVVKT